ncbi:MAG: helix-turn-helix domain-containing protein, partial [Desulfopila sp.]
VEDVDPGTLENPGKSLVGGCILGAHDFVDWVTHEFLSSEGACREKPQLTAFQSGVELRIIVAAVCDMFEVEVETVLAKGKKRNLARDVTIYLSRKLAHMSGNELGRYFGDISGAAITMRYKVIAKKIQEDKKLKDRIDRLEEQIVNN